MQENQYDFYQRAMEMGVDDVLLPLLKTRFCPIFLDLHNNLHTHILAGSLAPTIYLKRNLKVFSHSFGNLNVLKIIHYQSSEQPF